MSDQSHLIFPVTKSPLFKSLKIKKYKCRQKSVEKQRKAFKAIETLLKRRTQE